VDLIRNPFRYAKPPQLLAERGGALDETAGDATEQALVVVEARKALMSRSVAKTVTASNSAVMNLSGALTVRAGDDIVVTAGGAGVMIAGGDLHMEGGAGGVIAAKEAHVESGFVGLLLARRASMGEQTRVLITTRQAVLIGVLIGALFPLTRYLLRRFAPQADRPSEARRDTPAAVRFGRWLLGRALRIAVVALVGWLIYRWARKRAEPVLRMFRRR
jgi:hypothetical protein